MKTRQAKEVPSEFEMFEEEETQHSDDFESSEYEPASDKESSADEDSNAESSQSRVEVAHTTVTAMVNCPLDAISQTPIQVIFHLNPPKYTLLDVFTSQELSQLGLQILAQANLSAAGDVSPAQLSSLLLTFSKLNNKVITMDYLAKSMGMTTIPTLATDSKTFAAFSPEDIVTKCEELLLDSHLDYTRNQQIFHLLHYYFLLRTPIAGATTKPSQVLRDMFVCLCKGWPFPFHTTLFKAL
ncbi:hypothetical protein L7F22_038001 [Adiantum nelumboides]|nr:hypothetical protein [Adiantum nelumboides]